MIKIKAPQTKLEKSIFAKTFERIDGHCIPQDYLFSKDSRTFGAYDSRGKLLGGFCLVKGDPKLDSVNLRTVEQANLFCFENLMLTEITGYFIKDKRCGFKLTMKLVIETFKSASYFFIYSYNTSNKKLESYYKTGNPKRVFSGYIYYGNDYNIENVEILSKLGIIKIFLNRTMRLIKRKMR